MKIRSSTVSVEVSAYPSMLTTLDTNVFAQGRARPTRRIVSNPFQSEQNLD